MSVEAPGGSYLEPGFVCVSSSPRSFALHPLRRWHRVSTSLVVMGMPRFGMSLTGKTIKVSGSARRRTFGRRWQSWERLIDLSGLRRIAHFRARHTVAMAILAESNSHHDGIVRPAAS